MARYVLTNGVLVYVYKQASTPTTLQGLTVGDIWIDTSSTATAKVCTSISPVTFADMGSGGGGTPGGSNTQVQFNDNSSFGGDAGLTYNKTTDSLTVAGTISASNFSGTSSGTNTGDKVTTKGDINIYGASNTRLPVGSNGKALFADSTTPEGLAYDYQDLDKTHSFIVAHDFSNSIPGTTETTCQASGTGTGNTSNDYSTTFTGGTAVGVIGLETGTTSVGRYSIRLLNSLSLYPGNGQLVYEARVRLKDLSDDTDTYSVNVGLFNLSVASPITAVLSDLSVCFNYTHGTNSGKWQGFCKNSSSSTVDLGTTVVVDTWYNLKIVIDATYSLITFYINGSSVGTLNSNLPTSSSVHAPGLIILKSAGTNNRIMYSDYIKVRKDFTTPR